ncbi:MAG: tRNA dihydrouridine synthase [Candidatus Muiribacteriota bacterium]
MIKELKIKNKILKNNIITAPIAGYTDLPWRKLIKKMGASLIFTEMISVEALCRENEKTLKMLDYYEALSWDPFFSIQLFGNKVASFLKSIEILEKKFPYEFININMGCPVKKVLKAKAGCYYLDNINEAINIIKKIKKEFPEKILSIKTRTGINNSDDKGLQLCKAASEAGVDFIIVHGRSKKDFFSGKVDYLKIKEINNSVNIPVIANGDIKTLNNIDEILKKTGCEGVMIGRGFFENPFLIKNEEGSKGNFFGKHYKEMINYYGRDKAYILIRKFFPYYKKNFKKKIKHLLISSRSYYDFEKILKEEGII